MMPANLKIVPAMGLNGISQQWLKMVCYDAKHGGSLSDNNASVVGLTIVGDCPGDKSGM